MLLFAACLCAGFMLVGGATYLTLSPQLYAAKLRKTLKGG